MGGALARVRSGTFRRATRTSVSIECRSSDADRVLEILTGFRTRLVAHLVIRCLSSMGYALGNLFTDYESFDPPSTPAMEVRAVPIHHF
jgi:hypothetical protein